MPENRDELIRPAVEGTRRAIIAALEANVERIVLTSSAAAIAYGHPPDKTAFSEADWSTTSGDDVNAYTESKTRAELKAWSLMETAGRREALAVINPVVVLGPLLGRDHGVSAMLVKRLLNGVPFAPRTSLDLSMSATSPSLHVNAMTRPDGRRAAGTSPPPAPSASSISPAISPSRIPASPRRLPRYEVPDALVRLYALFDRDAQCRHPQPRPHPALRRSPPPRPCSAGRSSPRASPPRPPPAASSTSALVHPPSPAVTEGEKKG
jgi:hypothetical protein